MRGWSERRQGRQAVSEAKTSKDQIHHRALWKESSPADTLNLVPRDSCWDSRPPELESKEYTPEHSLIWALLRASGKAKPSGGLETTTGRPRTPTCQSLNRPCLLLQAALQPRPLLLHRPSKRSLSVLRPYDCHALGWGIWLHSWPSSAFIRNSLIKHRQSQPWSWQAVGCGLADGPCCQRELGATVPPLHPA